MREASLTSKELALEPASLDIMLRLGRRPWSQLCRFGRLGNLDTWTLIADEALLDVSHDEPAKGDIDISAVLFSCVLGWLIAAYTDAVRKRPR